MKMRDLGLRTGDLGLERQDSGLRAEDWELIGLGSEGLGLSVLDGVVLLLVVIV